MKEKKVFLRRKEAKGYLPKEILVAARVTLGSVFVGRQPLNGLTPDESQRFLPEILGLPHSHPDFPRAEKNYWASLRIKVPFEGKEFDVSLDANGNPVNVSDYINYKWALKHPQVAETKEGMKVHNKRFYIYDPERDLLKKNNAVQNAKDADKEFLKASQSEERMARLLRVLTNSKPEQLTAMQVENELYEYKTKNPKKFYKACIDKDLDLKDEIAEMVQLDVLRKIGNQYIHEDETLGETLQDTLVYFKNKKNSGAINAIRAKLKTVK
tara:strand:+ start:2065 stop:2871 length:807 start_codon:yes stop_codon:yes gene_type:complete